MEGGRAQRAQRQAASKRGTGQAGKSQQQRLTYPEPIGIGQEHAFEIFTGVAILFFLISFPLTRLAAVLEKRLA